MDKLQGGEKEKAAEGAVFAAAVLPRIHAVNPDTAQTVYDNMRMDAQSTDFKAVRNAFEYTYPILGIKCSDIGGLYNAAEANYYAGMEPCADDTTTTPEDTTALTATDNHTIASRMLPCRGGHYL